jgi:hypothetical protein
MRLESREIRFVATRRALLGPEIPNQLPQLSVTKLGC